MKYALLICDDESVSPSNEELEADAVHQAWQADLDRRGAKLGGVRLRPVVDATTVRVRGGETLVSDGPVAETKDFVREKTGSSSSASSSSSSSSSPTSSNLVAPSYNLPEVRLRRIRPAGAQAFAYIPRLAVGPNMRTLPQGLDRNL